MENRTDALISIRDLTVHFSLGRGRIVRAVDGVTLNIYKGETLGLVGESGCGKSTLGRAILRLTEPTSGQVLFEGKNVAEASGWEMKALRRDMQIITAIYEAPTIAELAAMLEQDAAPQFSPLVLLKAGDDGMLGAKVFRGLNPAVVYPLRRVLIAHSHADVVVDKIDLVNDVRYRPGFTAEALVEGLLGKGLQILEKDFEGALDALGSAGFEIHE